MEPDTGRLLTVEVERLDRFFDVRPRFIPGVALGEDALRQALRAVAAIGFLRHLEYDFVHNIESKLAVAARKSLVFGTSILSLWLERIQWR